MAFFKSRGPRYPILSKVIGCLGSIVMGIASYQAQGLLLTIGFVVLGLSFGYEAYALGVQHRAVKTIERIPFIVIFGILVLVNAIHKTYGGL